MHNLHFTEVLAGAGDLVGDVVENGFVEDHLGPVSGRFWLVVSMGIGVGICVTVVAADLVLSRAAFVNRVLNNPGLLLQIFGQN